MLKRKIMSTGTYQSTSFSLIPKRLNELGEDDLFGADNEFLVAELCFGPILQCCSPCL